MSKKMESLSNMPSSKEKKEADRKEGRMKEESKGKAEGKEDMSKEEGVLGGGGKTSGRDGNLVGDGKMSLRSDTTDGAAGGSMRGVPSQRSQASGDGGALTATVNLSTVSHHQTQSQPGEGSEVNFSDVSSPSLYHSSATKDDLLGSLAKSEDATLTLAVEETPLNLASIDFSTPDAPENIVFAPDGSIKGATVEKIVQKLTSTDSNVSLLFDFLITYRSYTTPEHLLNLLKRRFEQVVDTEDMKVVRLRVMNFVRQWIEKHTYDWIDDPSLILRFTAFIEHWETIDPSSQRTAVLLTGLLRKAASGETSAQEKKKKLFNTPPPPPEFPSELDPAKLHLTQISTAELARQFTLLDWSLWEAIKPSEFLNCNWASKTRKDTLAPNILALTRNFNQSAGWVARTILLEHALADRVKIVTKFIQLAEELRNLANFNGLMGILSGLSSASIHRLKQTWEALPKPISDLYAHLKSVMSQEKSYKVYRDLLKTVNPPTIPFIGISLTDLTFCYEGSKDSIEGGLVNFTKSRMLAQTIKNIIQYQHTPYHFVTVPVIRDYLKYPTTWDEPSLYQYSLYVEPKAGTEPPSSPPPVVCTSPPPPWLSQTHTATATPSAKITKEPPRDWKSSTLVIRRSALRAADLLHAVTFLLYISESDPNFNSFSNTFFYSITYLGGLQKILQTFEQILAQAPLIDEPSATSTAISKTPATSEAAADVPKKSQDEMAPSATSLSLPPSRHTRSLSTPSDESGEMSPKGASGDAVEENGDSISNNPDSLSLEPFSPPKTKKELTIRILEVSVYWGTRYGSGLTKDQKTLNTLQSWMEQRLILVEGMRETVQGAIVSFIKTIPILGLEATRRASSVAFPKVHPVPNMPLNQLSIRMFNPEEIARQLALWYQGEVNALTRDEIYSVSSSSSSSSASLIFKGKPTTLALISLAMQQEKWVRAEMAATEGSKKKRLATFECLVETAQYSLELNNFMAVRHLYNGLSDPAFEPLLENASKKVKDIWSQLRALLGPATPTTTVGTNSNVGTPAWHQKIASLLNSNEQAMVLPLDWIESAIAHNLTERDWWKGRLGIFNFDKLGMMAQTWRSIERSKQPYNFMLCPTLKDYIIAAATDAINDIPLGSAPSSARDKKKSKEKGEKNDKSGEKSGDKSGEKSGDKSGDKSGEKNSKNVSNESSQPPSDELDDSDESASEETDFSDEDKKEKEKKRSVFKSVFGKKKETPSPSTSSSSLAIPSISTTSISGDKSSSSEIPKSSRKEGIIAMDDKESKDSPKETKHASKELNQSKEMKRQSSATERMTTRSGSKPDITPRNSRGGSASSNTSSQESVSYANTPDFRASVLKMVQEDEDFRSALLSALRTSGSGQTSPTSTERRIRRPSAPTPEQVKIAELEAQIVLLKQQLSRGTDASDQASSEGM